MSKLHIAVGTKNDPDYLIDSAKNDGSLVWPVPKKARIGDMVLFLIPAYAGDLVASGSMMTMPVPSKNWAPKYEAKIGNINLRGNPIPIDLLRDRLPGWKYLTYARGYTTVPDQFVKIIEKLLLIDRRFDLEAGVSADEVEPPRYREGAVRKVLVNAYERNPEARRRCIEHYGSDCFVCGFASELSTVQ